MAPEYKNIPRTLCEFRSISPSTGQSGPKCCGKHPDMALPTLKHTYPCPRLCWSLKEEFLEGFRPRNSQGRRHSKC